MSLQTFSSQNKRKSHYFSHHTFYASKLLWQVYASIHSTSDDVCTDNHSRDEHVTKNRARSYAVPHMHAINTGMLQSYFYEAEGPVSLESFISPSIHSSKNSSASVFCWIESRRTLHRKLTDVLLESVDKHPGQQGSGRLRHGIFWIPEVESI